MAFSSKSSHTFAAIYPDSTIAKPVESGNKYRHLCYFFETLRKSCSMW